MRLGTKRNTFSEYDWAVARSTACLASTISREARRRRVDVALAIAREWGEQGCNGPGYLREQGWVLLSLPGLEGSLQK
jgi:hypothetical protein